MDRNLLDYLAFSHRKLSPYCDGNIYRTACLLERGKCDRAAAVWKCKTTKRKARFFNLIVKPLPDEDGARLSHRLHELLQFPGLWEDFSLGYHRIEGSRYTTESQLYPHQMIANYWQELAHYLQRIHATWTRISLNRPDLVSVCTVRMLEGLSPLSSSQDRITVENVFENNEVFESVHDPVERQLILTAVLEHPGRILSLRLLQEDTKLLDAAAKMMALLIKSPFQGSLRVHFKQCFLKDSDDVSDDDFRNAYHRLWLYAWANPRNVHIPAINESRVGSETCTNHYVQDVAAALAALADSLQFQSPHMVDLLKTNDFLTHLSPRIFPHASSLTHFTSHIFPYAFYLTHLSSRILPLRFLLLRQLRLLPRRLLSAICNGLSLFET